MSILIVDDNDLIRRLLPEIIKTLKLPFPAKTLAAENAAEALNIIFQQAEKIRIVISDVNMPGKIDGLGLLQTIGQLYPEIPVAIMSCNPENENLAYAEGAKFFIYKSGYLMRQIASMFGYLFPNSQAHCA